MTEHEEVWLPLVDEPIGSIVAQIQADDPEISLKLIQYFDVPIEELFYLEKSKGE